MSTARGIVAAIGPASVAVVGASATATGVATVVVAAGAAAALGFAGYGVYCYFANGSDSSQVPDKTALSRIPPEAERLPLSLAESNKKPWWKVWG